MDKYLILKNALVLTFDKNDSVGYYNIVIKNNIIHEMDFENELNYDRNIYTKYPGVNIIDARDKIIIPALFNSSLNSSFALSSVFFERLNYDRLSDNISLAMLEKHFKNHDNKSDLKSLLIYSLFRALNSGEIFVNQTSEYISHFFLNEFSKYNFLVVQDIIYTAYEEALSRYLAEQKRFHCVGIRDENGLNNYSVSNAIKSVKEGRKKLFFDILQKSGSQEEIKNTFLKSFFRVLAENDFLDSRAVFCNPVHIQKDELEYIAGRNANIVLCPSDLINLAGRRPENFNFIKYGINCSIGTGCLGKSVLSELKYFSGLVRQGSASYRSLLKMAVVNPAVAFEVSSLYGSIEVGKLASLVLFDVADLGNYFINPEISSEKVCGHIIENLDANDISDVIIKGNVIRRDHKSKLYDTETMKHNTEELARKVFETGKYYEFREKYLMRKRIKELSLNNEPEVNNVPSYAEQAQDDTIYSLDNAVISDSEFRIIGMQTDVSPISASGEEEDSRPSSRRIFELENIDSGLTLFEEETVLVSSGKTAVVRRMSFEDFSGDTGKEEEKEQQVKTLPEKEKKAVFKKSKLRFGFSDDNEK